MMLLRMIVFVTAICLSLAAAPMRISEGSIIQSDFVFFVSTSGDDDNPGTLERPWRTIQKAVDEAGAGDIILVRDGVYEEFVTITSAGSPLIGYIEFRAYPGERPVIDGANLVMESEDQALLQFIGARYVIVDGFEIRNLDSTKSSEYPAGIRMSDGGSNVVIRNNDIHHIVNTSSEGNAHGIHIYGNTLEPITKIDLIGNKVHDLVLGSSESVTLSGNIDGFTVSNNDVFNNNNIGIDIAGFYGACSSPCIDQARNGVVADNTVHHIDTSDNPAYGIGHHSAGGIYIDGGRNVLVERNHLYNNDFGLELASENEGKFTSYITVKDNDIHSNDGAGIMMGGSEISNGGSSHNQIYSNKVMDNDTLNQGYAQIALQENNFDNRIWNNAIYAPPGGIMIQKWNTSGMRNSVDYNFYYSSAGPDGVLWNWDERDFEAMEDYKRVSGLDAHSLFLSPESFKFHRK